MAKEHNRYTKVAAQWLIKQQSIDVVACELGWGDSVFDVVGVSANLRSLPKISVIEVKVSRADLLQDLKKQKMLKYANHASHCYVAATEEAFGTNDPAAIVADLTQRGLPFSWGILLLPKRTTQDVISIRSCRQLQKPHPLTIQRVTTAIAKSYMWKYLLKE